MYSFAIIDPRTPVVPARTLGIEVTIPSVAAMCDLGNIDEQHTPEGGRAACAVALEHPLPPEGATLATIRPDLDALAAMAALALRAAGVEMDDAARARIAQIAEADARTDDPTWTPRPLPTREQPWTGGAVEDRAALAPLNAICQDRALVMAFRVACVAAWLISERDDRYEIASRSAGIPYEPTVIARALCDARERVTAERLDMIAALEDGRIKLREEGGIALVTSEHRGAMGLGYCLAPVVVALNPTHRWPSGEVTSKGTVAFFRSPGVETMTRVRDALNAIEPGWGGNLASGILGSRQNRATEMSVEQIASIVRGAL